MALTGQSFALVGGLNVADEQYTLKPGELTDCLNIDVSISGGYSRTGGYEAFDGRVATPSVAQYRMLAFSSGGPRAVQYGDAIVGGVSGATATICGQASLVDGVWFDSSAQGLVGITQETGTFIAGETVTISGIVAFIASGASVESSLDDPNRKDYRRGAANAARAVIGIVPGSGDVRCVFTLKGTTFAIRDNEAGTAGAIYKATTAGWVLQPPSPLLAFDAGDIILLEGDNINGQTSGATATVVRVAFEGGSWNTNDAKGRLALTNVVGTFQDNENIRIGSTVHAVVNGVLATPTIPVGGKYECRVWNFYASFDTQRAYIVNGVGQAFEFDENAMVPIVSGMPDDKPEHVAIHKNYLYLTFKGSVQNSGAGEPHSFTARLGATEIGVGEKVTTIYSIRNDVLGVATLNSLHLLYGSSQVDWQFKKMSDLVGAYPGAMIDVPGSTVVVDKNGMQAVNTSQNFGDFDGASVSRKVNPLIRAIGAPVGILPNRIKSQIRVFYPDGQAVVATYAGDRIIGWTKWSYPNGISCVWEGEDSSGQEVSYFGSTNGYVYQLDRGNSFDGVAIQSLIRTAFNHFGGAERKKRWRRLTVEMMTRDNIGVQYAMEYDYADEQFLSFTPPLDPTNGGYYDKGFQYGDFVYDGGFLAKVTGYVDGISTNVSFLFYVEDDVAEQWSMQTVHLQFSNYGLNR